MALLSLGLVAGGNIVAEVTGVETVEVTKVKENYYVGAGLKISSEYTYDKDYTSGGSLIGGYQYNDNLAVEARGSWMDSIKEDGTLTASMFIKPQAYGLYSLLGFTYEDTPLLGEEYSLAFGGGFEMEGFFLDGVYRLESEESVATLGYIYRF